MSDKPPLSPIAPFKLERYFARWEFNAPYLLCSSDIQGYQMKELLSLADGKTRKLWNQLSLGYTETAGHPLLRAAIAELYNQTEAEDILCFAGAEEAIYIVQRVLLEPGAHVVITFPGYQSSYQVAETIGAQISHWNLYPYHLADGRVTWRADLDELRRLVRPNTRLIMVNFPHNPTGALLTHQDWTDLVDIARQAGCYLLSDEVYRFLEYHPEQRLYAAVDMYEKGLSLGVMSKPFAMAGLRIGWLAAQDRDLLAQLAAYKDYTTICCSAPSEILALIGLRARERVLTRSLDLLQTNLALVEDGMSQLTEFFEWIPPQAGSICFPRWRGPGSIEAFCEALVQTEGVLLLPGSVYDFPGEHFRFGLGRENLPEALDRLVRFARKYG